MALVLIDSHEVVLGDDERLNGVQAARRAGIEIPHYCWHPGLSVVASCRMCLVETGTRNPQNGQITMLPKLVPACQTPARDGTVFVTDSDLVRRARAQVEEGLLIDHPIDCPICDKAGECFLQDYHFRYGQPQRRADIRPFTSRRRPVGDTVTLFVDRCIMCSRCVRFTREISGTNELMVTNRGSREEIDVFPGYPLANKLAGNVVDLCPVGALGDVDFLYRQRVWFLTSHPHVCAGCATGCSIGIEENQDRIYRVRPRENPKVNEWWICDEGRYGYHHVHDTSRWTEPSRREAEEWVPVPWSNILPEIDARFRGAGHVAGVLSPFLTVEEAALLAEYLRRLDPRAMLVLGPVPVEGKDERFPKGFVIHAEKCPNRRGVEEVIRHFTGEVIAVSDFLSRWRSEGVDAAWISGGYPRPWASSHQAGLLRDLDLLVLQELLPSPLDDVAHYRLPAAAFAEKSGSFVNHAGWLQSFSWAVRPPTAVWTEGEVYWHLLEKPGLYRPRSVMAELAECCDVFAPAREDVPPLGVSLRLDAARTSHGAAEIPQAVS